MATIETRENNDGTTGYRVKVRLKGFPTQSATFTRKTDAKEWAKQTETEIKQGRYFKTAEAKKHTVGKLIDRYLNDTKKRNPKRYQDIKGILEWWKKEIGVYLLSDITKAFIIERRDKLLSTSSSNNVEKRSSSTVNRYMTALGHVFTLAINEWEWMHDHPMKKISKLPEPRGRVRYLDDDERERLLRASKEEENYLYLLVVLALSTGARHGELIDLLRK
ncbi:MAG: hypothetical protein K2Q34_05710 [Alphaproteobacteria bacterium]|nr:hypothetical protein [Alphaproteobacteria bacterium]